MAIPRDKSNNVYNAFYRYVRDRNKAEIESFSIEEIEMTCCNTLQTEIMVPIWQCKKE